MAVLSDSAVAAYRADAMAEEECQSLDSGQHQHQHQQHQQHQHQHQH